MSIKSSPLDWLSLPPSSPGDIHAPHPDLFELDLDSSIIALPQGDQEQLQLLNIELSDPYAFVRSETPRCGPPSTFTVSSESTYDSYSSHSESLYNYSSSPSDFDNNGEFRVDLGIDFSRFSVDVDAAAAEAKVQLTASNSIKDEPDTGLTLLSKMDTESSLSTSHNNVFYGSTEAGHRSSYQEGLTSAAAAVSRNTTEAPQPTAEYYAAIYNQPVAAVPSTISPSTLLPSRVSGTLQKMEHTSTSPSPSASNSAQSVGSTGASPTQNELSERHDPRKKYKCTACPRGNMTASGILIMSAYVPCHAAFARAYNLKTHLQTHDPNRLKPHTCPHRSCGRSFSRKHDLGRHLVSIHRDEPSAVADMKQHAIGVAQGSRGWCDDCGAGWVGKQATCACNDVK